MKKYILSFFIFFTLLACSFAEMVPYVQLMHDGFVHSISITNDGKTLAIGTDNTLENRGGVFLRNTSNSLEYATLDDNGKNLPPVKQLDFSPDNAYLAAGCSDGTIFVWNMKTKALSWKAKIHQYSITDLAFSPDGKYLASCAGTFVVTDAQNPKYTYCSEASDQVVSVAWKTDSSKIALGCGARRGKASVKLLDVKTNKIVTEHSVFKNRVSAIAWTKDNTIVSASWDGSVSVWNSENQTDEKSIVVSEKELYALALSPDQNSFVVCGADKTNRIYDRHTLALLNSSTEKYTSFDCLYYPDGSMIEFASLWPVGASTFKWNMNDMKGFVSGALAGLSNVVMNPSDGSLLSASLWGGITIWDRDYMRPSFSEWVHDNSAGEIQFSDDGKFAWSVSTDGTLVKYDVKAHKVMGTPVAYECDPARLIDAIVVPKWNELWCGTNDGDALCIDLDTGKIKKEIHVLDNAFVLVQKLKDDSILLYANTIPQQTDLYTISNNELYDFKIGYKNQLKKFILIDSKTYSEISHVVIKFDEKLESKYFSSNFILYETKGGLILACSTLGELYVIANNKGELELKTIITVSSKRLSAVTEIGNNLYAGDAAGTLYMLGTEDELLTKDGNQFVKKQVNYHTGSITKLIGDRDEKNIISSCSDGVIRIYNLETERWVGMGASLNQSEWIIFTDDGYWDGSLDCKKLISMSSGDDAYSVEQFSIERNRPDIVLKQAGSTDVKLLAHYKNMYEKRHEQYGKIGAVTSNWNTDAIPSAKIVSTKQDGNVCTIKYTLTANKGTLASWSVWNNGVPLSGITGNSVSKATCEGETKVILVPGRNEIELSCMNSNGDESIRENKILYYSGVEKGRLVYLGFGVSNYADTQLTLRWAAKDAVDAGTIFSTNAKGYESVVVKTWTDSEVTETALAEAEEIMKSLSEKDTVVLFIAGHGVHDDDSTYYYLGYDAAVENLANTAIPFERIESLLFNTKARSKLFFMDTCESGEDTDEISGLTPITFVASRGIKEKKHVRTVSSVAVSLRQKDRWIYNNLSRRSGAIVFSSCRGTESSYEFDDLENGAFTAALIRCFNNQTLLDENGDGSISTRELRKVVPSVVSELVVERTGMDVQHPVVDRDNLKCDVQVKLK